MELAGTTELHRWLNDCWNPLASVSNPGRSYIERKADGFGVEPRPVPLVREGFISVQRRAASEGAQMPPDAPSMPMALPEAESGEGSPQKQQKKASMLAQRSRRRIFVQTDNGSVLGMEVHRSDKVQSIKKKVQEVLRVPTEQSALFFGDHELEDDVRELRCDSPVLLTSELHRSSSTPCFCPSPLLEPLSRGSHDDDDDDDAGPFEIVGGWACCSRIKRLIDESSKAIKCGVEPVRAQGGLGGAYYFRDCRGNKIAIVKPADEEPLAPNNPRGFVGRRLGQAGLSRSIRVGETGVREVAAYLLDHGHFAQVPATVLVKASHPIFHLNSEPGRPWTPRKHTDYLHRRPGTMAKIGSFQEFVEHDYDATECGCSRFPTSAVHRIGILDVRLFNTDRHAGNILVKHANGGSDLCSSWGRFSSGGVVDLIPIDHGLCLPESLEDPYFEWLHWPQASFPFSEEEVEYIRGLDPAKDADMLRKQLPMLKEACVRMMVLCTSFLKRAVAGGLCLADIGSMMSREIASGVTSSSELERMCMLARLDAQQSGEEEQDGDCSEKEDGLESSWEQQDMFQIDIDPDEFPQGHGALLQDPASSPKRPSFRRQQPGSPVKLYRSFSAVQEMRPVLEEEDEAAVPADSSMPVNGFSSAGKSSSSSDMISASYASAATPFFVKKQRSNTFASAATQKRSSARPPETAVALSSMNEKEWNLFMECFDAISADAFARHAEESSLVRPQQRLGTSCQF